MPRNPSSGLFTRVNNSFSEPVLGTIIDPTDAGALFDDYDLGLTGTPFITTLNNIIAGGGAGDAITTGEDNILLGRNAGTAITNGVFNIGIGPNTITTLTTGDNNIAIGESALQSVTTADDNIAIGEEAGFSLTTGILCVYIGANAGHDNTDGIGDVCVGSNAGANLLGGGFSNYRTCIGDAAAQNATATHAIVAVGRAAGLGMTTDLRTIAIGHAAMLWGGGTTDCVAIGNSGGGTPIDGTDPNGIFGLVNDVNVIVIGTETGKMSAAARTNCVALGYRATVPIKNNTMTLGKGITDINTTARVFQGLDRSTNTTVGAATLTTDNMLLGFCSRSASGGAFNDTTPTAAQLVAAGPGVGASVPCSRFWYYKNGTGGGGGIMTILAGAGVTISGGATVSNVAPILSSWIMVFSNTTSGAEAVTLYRLDT